MNRHIIEKIKILPQNPGIYIFKSRTGEFLYIGKAGNLKNRLKQYLSKKTSSPYKAEPSGFRPFLEHLIDGAEKIETKTTSSEIEALILESKLIKEKQPKFNIMLRDDKQYFYVGFTNEEFPKIFLTHRPLAIKRGVTRLGVPHRAQIAIEHYGGEEGQDPEAYGYIGPFTDGTALKSTLRLLRKAFPYCTCKQKHNNFCLNYHIGKCLGYCCLKQPELSIKYKALSIYKRNVKAIKDILSGKKESLIKKLKKELNQLAKSQQFEEAINLRNKIEKLKRVFENARIINDAIYQSDSKITTFLETFKNTFKLRKIPTRIEGYDISNIQGKNATGSMVVFIDGKPDPEGEPSAPYGASKKEYRKFKIIFKNTPDDIAMLKEVLIRRFNHPEWPYPDLIFIDGGINQLNAAKKVMNLPSFAKASKGTAIISLAKGKQEVFSTTLKKPMPMKKLPTEIKNLILNIDSEAHRFAINYYRKLHRRTALPKTDF